MSTKYAIRTTSVITRRYTHECEHVVSTLSGELFDSPEEAISAANEWHLDCETVEVVEVRVEVVAEVASVLTAARSEANRPFVLEG